MNFFKGLFSYEEIDFFENTVVINPDSRKYNRENLKDEYLKLFEPVQSVSANEIKQKLVAGGSIANKSKTSSDKSEIITNNGDTSSDANKTSADNGKNEKDGKYYLENCVKFLNFSNSNLPDFFRGMTENERKIDLILLYYRLKRPRDERYTKLENFIFNKKVGTLQSIFTGYKNIEGESIKLSSFQKILATVGIVSAIAIFPYSELNQKVDIKSEHKEQPAKGNEDSDED